MRFSVISFIELLVYHICYCTTNKFIALNVSIHSSGLDRRLISQPSSNVLELDVSPETGSSLLWASKYNPDYYISSILDYSSIISQPRNLRRTNANDPYNSKHHSVKHIDKLEPISTFKRRDNGNESLFINWHWDIGDKFGMLNIPHDERNSSTPYKLLVDVGLEKGSYLVCDVLKDPNLVFIGIEANLVNFGVSHHNMLGKIHKNSPVRERILLLPLGLSNETTNILLNENYAPACGSILKSKPKGWYCTHTTNSYEIPVTRLDFILSKVPPDYQFHYLKVDVEGADHLVIFGAADYISNFRMVSLECRPPNHMAGDQSREGTCQQAAMITYMTKYGFSQNACDDEDCHFAKPGFTLQETKKLFEKCHTTFHADGCK